jgi:hypothetical protein
MDRTVHAFSAILDIIGINPFVPVPESILQAVFVQVGKDRGPIPIKGTINGKGYRQTLVKYRGQWRLYINTEMLDSSPKRTGETIDLTITYDPGDRTISPHPKLVRALGENQRAQEVFHGLSRSKRQEIIKYISFLKTQKSIEVNIKRAILFLEGKGRFLGRDRP